MAESLNNTSIETFYKGETQFLFLFSPKIIVINHDDGEKPKGKFDLPRPLLVFLTYNSRVDESVLMSKVLMSKAYTTQYLLMF